MKRKITVAAIMALAVAARVFAHDTDVEGKDIVQLGRMIIVEGILEIEDHELYLKTDQLTYAVHIGPDYYSEEIAFPMENGNRATVSGFVLSSDIAARIIVIRGETYIFRDKNGNLRNQKS